MKIEFTLLSLDELDIGIHMNYAEDEIGECHVITFGFFFFTIEIIKYF